VIELPTVLVDLTKQEAIAEFQTYVRPTHCPKLTPFCTELTGIQQTWVNDAPAFPEAWARYEDWLSSRGCTPENTLLLTCGDWDLKTMLDKQLALCPELTRHPLTARWCNIKHWYRSFYKRANPPRGMVDMLQGEGLKLEGRHHSGR
jgi:ERI1 exoribonuclease 3